MCIESDLQTDYYGMEFCVICGCRLKEGIKPEEPVHEPMLRPF